MAEARSGGREKLGETIACMARLEGSPLTVTATTEMGGGLMAT